MSDAIYHSADWAEFGWHEDAKCKGMDTDLFYYSVQERGPKKLERAENAKSICADCPVKQQCLADAVNRDDRYSIQGGTTPEERGATTLNTPCHSLEQVLINLYRKEKVNA
jgi:WhiB family redox-sensing transcriptional regulator